MKRGDILDLTLMQKKGLLNKASEIKPEIVDLTKKDDNDFLKSFAEASVNNSGSIKNQIDEIKLELQKAVNIMAEIERKISRIKY